MGHRVARREEWRQRGLGLRQDAGRSDRAPGGSGERQMAAAGVPPRAGTGVRQSPSLRLGAPPGAFVVEAWPSPSSPTGDPDLVGPTGWTDRGVRIRGQTIERETLGGAGLRGIAQGSGREQGEMHPPS